MRASLFSVVLVCLTACAEGSGTSSSSDTRVISNEGGVVLMLENGVCVRVEEGRRENMRSRVDPSNCGL